MKFHFIFGFWAILLSSCAVHPPVLPHAPLLSEKKEFQVGINSQNLVGGNGNISYAFADHFAIKANGSYSFDREKDGSYNAYEGIEMGLGVFSKVGGSDLWLVEFYSGYGLGRLQSYERPSVFFGPLFGYQDDFYRLRSGYRNYYGQLAIGFKGDKRADFVTGGLGIKADLVNFKDLHIDRKPLGNVHGIFLKPFAFLRVGLENFQLQMEASISAIPSPRLYQIGFTSPDYMVGLGLVYNHRPKTKENY